MFSANFHSFIGAYSPGWIFGLPFWGILITHIQTHSRIPLDELSAHRRDLYLHRTTQQTNIHAPSGSQQMYPMIIWAQSQHKYELNGLILKCGGTNLTYPLGTTHQVSQHLGELHIRHFLVQTELHSSCIMEAHQWL
jgi:hypothetical protein